MKQKGFIDVLILIIVIAAIAGIGGYVVLNKQTPSPGPVLTPILIPPTPNPSENPIPVSTSTSRSNPIPIPTPITPKTNDLNSPCRLSRFCSDGRLAPSGYGWVTGCVNVLLTGGTTREQARSLLKQLNIKEPAVLSENIKPYGTFVPTIEVIVGDFNQTVSLLKYDPRIINVQLHYHSTSPSTDPNASYFVYVLFADSITSSQGYKLLSDTYKLRVNGDINYIIPDGVLLGLEVPPGSENSTVQALRKFLMVQYATQCPVPPPGHAN